MTARVRVRDQSDVEACVAALRAVYETSGYPTNWPADPARWLESADALGAWVAATEEIPVAGHVIVQRPQPGPDAGSAEISRLFVVPAARRQGVGLVLLDTAKQAAAARGLDLFLDVTDHLAAARALYQQAGFRLAGSRRADWTGSDGGPVTLHRYAWSRLSAPEPVSGAWRPGDGRWRGGGLPRPGLRSGGRGRAGRRR